MTVTKTRHPGKNTTAHRTPYLFPLDVYYDDETRQIEVEGDENIEAQVFVCDENGNTLDYSPYINNVLSVPYSYQGVIVIRIENEDWIAIGSIPV